MRVASHRLIDAAAKLAPGDRALLSLLVNHGLDDGALARVMHATPEEIETRRERLAERLGTVLALPSANVQDALDELVGSVREHRVEVEPSAAPADREGGNHANSDGEATPEPADGEATPEPAAGETTPEPAAGETTPEPAAGETVTGETVTGEAAPSAPRAQPNDSAERPHRRGWIALGLAALIVVLVIVIASSGGNQKPHGSAAATHSAGTSTQPASSTPQPAAPVLGRGSLAVLPGGPAGVSGGVAVTGSQTSPQLKVTVSGLPPAASGGYELWLYNSVIDSVPLARLSAPNANITIALPAYYRKYRWLDVSLQPTGAVNHSGESLLRVAMPR